MAEGKTNAMRILEREKVPHQTHSYPHGDQPIDGVQVAGLIGEEPARVLKTLVTKGADNQHYVFVIPSHQELDLKKAAKAAGVKSLSMLPVADLLKVTGYVRGGCSPVGMKKQFTTFYDASAQALPYMIVSAGKIGMQIQLSPDDLIRLTRGAYAPVTKEAPEA